MMQEDWAELIDRYLEGQVNKDESQKIQRMLRDNESFREQYEFISTVKKTLTLQSEEERIKYLRQLSSQSQSPSSRRLRLIWAAVIGLVLALLFVIWYSWKLQNPSTAIPSSQEYAQLFSLPDNYLFPSTKNLKSAERSQIENAFAAYDQHNFNTALMLFAVDSSFSRSPQIQFYHAMAAIGAKEYSLASTILSAIETKDKKLSAKAEWYQSYVYEQQGDLAKAIELWRQIKHKPSHPYQEQAAQALLYHTQ